MKIKDDEEWGMFLRRVYQKKGFKALILEMFKGCLVWIIILPIAISIGVLWNKFTTFDIEDTIECIQDGPWINRFGSVERRLVFYTYEDFQMITKEGDIITSGKWKATDVGKIKVSFEYCKGGCGNTKGTTFEMPDCGEVRAGNTVYTRSGY